MAVDPVPGAEVDLKVDAQVEELRVQVAELRQAFDGIAAGGVDAVVVGPAGAERVFSLSTAERPYRLLVESMAEGAATVSASGTVLYANRKMCELLGAGSVELLGSSVDRFVVPADQPVLARLLTVELGETDRGSVVIAGPGSTPVELSVSCIETDDTVIRCLVATDLTRHKEVELLLEERLARRTDALASTSRHLESLTYAVAHDLRAPLRAINGFCHVLVEDHGAVLDADAREVLDRVQAAAVRMGVIIDALLALEGLARRGVRRVRVDLSAIAAEVAAGLAADDPTRVVRVEVEPEVVETGDPALVRTVLEVLLGNAWKFTRHTERAVVEFGSVEEAGARHFFVRDNGVGFDVAEGSRLFEPFQRMHRPSQFEGNGMGLAIAERLVGLLGGRIWAEATPGAGATFSFTIGVPPSEGRRT